MGSFAAKKTDIKLRNSSLDMLKGVAAIFVVFIHAHFPGLVGELIRDIGAFAVQVFFMVSGYFALNSSKEKLKKSIIHILQLIGIAYALNIVRIFIDNGFSFVETLGYFKDEIFTLKHIAIWLVFNATYVAGVAWFLFALLYCYLFCYVFHKFYNSKYVYGIIALGFIGGIACEILLPSIGISGITARNFWFCGIPYFLCGKLIHDKGEKLIQRKHDLYIISAAIIGLTLIVAGSLFYSGIIYVGSILLSIALFVICARYPNFKNKLLQKIGNEYAFFIYIGHPIVIHIFDGVFGEVCGVLAWLRPLIILVATIIFAAVFYAIKGWLKNAKFSKAKQNRLD